MPKRISRNIKDSNQIAAAVVKQSTSEDIDTQPLTPELLSQVMSEMGRKGGKIGGKRRLTTMTAVQRKKAASKAAKARWRKSRAK